MNDRRPRRSGLALLAVLGFLAAPAAAAPAVTWPADDYNPTALPGDVIVPLPCGGAIAFRKVNVKPDQANTTGEVLKDREVFIGALNDETAYLDYLRKAYLSGAFFDPARKDRYFLLGKYEVTVQQFDAVMKSPCPPPSADAGVPQTEISWFDAIDFTRRLTEWLYRNSPESLPADADRRGFVRLPTEVEWEFAARGGEAVSPVAFRDKLFPMEGPIAEYAWYDGPNSADGRLNLIGALKPNPLGLFDMLGNAEEIVLEPFYMNRAGRAHGQAGGLVTRGGSIRDAGNRLRTAMRMEYAPFDPAAKEATRLPTAGMRVVIAGTVLGDLARATSLQKGWASDLNLRTTPTRNAVDELRQIADKTTDLQLRRELERIQQAVAEESDARKAVEGRALSMLLMNGALLVRAIRVSASSVDKIGEAIKIAGGNPDGSAGGQDGDRQRIEGYRKIRQNSLDELRRNGEVYSSTLQQVARDFRSEQQDAAFRLLANDLRDESRRHLLGELELFEAQLREFRKKPAVGSQDMLQRLLGPKPWLNKRS